MVQVETIQRVIRRRLFMEKKSHFDLNQHKNCAKNFS